MTDLIYFVPDTCIDYNSIPVESNIIWEEKIQNFIKRTLGDTADEIPEHSCGYGLVEIFTTTLTGHEGIELYTNLPDPNSCKL